MNKLFLKVGAIVLGAGLVVGSGVAIAAHRESFNAANAAKGDIVEDEELSLNTGSSKTSSGNTYLEWSMASEKIIVQQLRSCASTAASTSEKTFTAVNNSYISAPRAYRGHTFAFTATDEYKIKKVVFTYTGSYYGLGLVVGDTLDSNASLTTPSSSTAYPVTGAVGVVSDTTNYSATKNTTDKTWTIQVNKTGGTTELYAQNYDNNTSTSTTQFRPTKIEITYVIGNEALAPDAITVNGSASMTVGEPEQFTATCTNSGSSTSVGQDVTWSSSDETVALVSLTGVVTPIGNGSANIVATSSLNSVSGQKAVTVSGAASTLDPKTFSSSSMSISGTAYASNDGYHVTNGFVVETSDVAQSGGDAKTGDVITTYQKYALIFKKGSGTVKTRSKMSANINKIVISGVSSDEPSLTVTGGASVGATTVTATVTSVGKIHTYSFATPVAYAMLKEDNSGTLYINSFTLEFVGGAETASSLADFVLGLIPDRNDETGLCDGATGNYQAAKARYVAAAEEVRSAFENGTAENIVAARTRYVQWAAVYGDSTPFATTYGARLPMSGLIHDNTTLVIVISSVIALVSIAGATLLILKKRKHN